MNIMKPKLDTFRRNVHSQNGEDGVIKELLRRLGLSVDNSFWCVEFGAWDGMHLSNIFALVEAHSATAVMIEGDEQKFRRLNALAEKHPSIIPVEGFVTGRRIPEDPLTSAFTGSFNPLKMATLDDLLCTTACPKDYDLLSIDIDSFDLEVWEAHREFSPKIVVIEINSGLEPGILRWHGNGKSGNSFSSTLAVAKSKGYNLVCHTGNMIFVRGDLLIHVGLDELDRDFPERLFNPTYLPRNQSRFSRDRLMALFQSLTQRATNRS